MRSFERFVFGKRKTVIVIFLTAAALGIFMLTGVSTNYNTSDYLPSQTQSTRAIEIMEAEFPSAVPNASVMVKDVSVTEALEFKSLLSGIPGIESVLWLDDVTDVKRPLQTVGSDVLDGFYKDSNALFSVSIKGGQEASAVTAIREVLGEKGAVNGTAAGSAAIQSAALREVLNAAAILLPIILLILILSTSSWIEPLLFLSAIGVSILINMGTNLFFKQISFVTGAVSPILQLAVSLDYAIFLLHSFSEYRREGHGGEEAMKLAVKKSVKAVSASAVTTLFGFLALTFMDFGIGADLGLNLAKGIILSFISCMVFLPALTLCLLPLLDKTRHRRFMPRSGRAGSLILKIAPPVLVLALVIAPAAFLGQRQTGFTYGGEDISATGRDGEDSAAITEVFGKTNILALLVPRSHVVSEYELCRDLESVKGVSEVTSFALTVGLGVPSEFLNEQITEQFYSENYARILIYTDVPYEGDEAFELVEAVNAASSEHYDEYFLAGQSASLYDMKNTVSKDNGAVNLIAIVSIFAVLLVTFKSASLPFIVLFTIEAGIWINLSIPFFLGNSINFLGYLVINTVQLGATVDYAILLTTYYLDNRGTMPKKDAARRSLNETFGAVLISASTLAFAGFTLGATSSNPSVSDLGLLLGRGTLLSLAMVVCVLPALLIIFDSVIRKTTFRANFHQKNKN